MKTVLISLFLLGFLTACNRERGPDLEKQIKALKTQLEEALEKDADEETINQIEKELWTSLGAYEIWAENELKKTTNKEDCIKIISKLDEVFEITETREILRKTLFQIFSLGGLFGSISEKQSGIYDSCGENGFIPKDPQSEQEKVEESSSVPATNPK